MGQKIDNDLNGGSVGEYIGGNQTNNYYTMFQDSEREFVVTHNANIKPVSYFTGRETELKDLRQRIEEGRKSVLVSGMGGIGKTHICRKLFEEYLNGHAKDGNGPFQHIGYIEYDGDMENSLKRCLKYKEQKDQELNQEAAWRELEYLASDGKLLLFIDNVDRSIGEDAGLKRLKGIPGAVVLTSRQASFSDEFEPYQIGFLDMEQCKEIFEKIRFGGRGRNIDSDEDEDLEHIIENLAGRHTITVELLAHLARTKTWSVRKLREKLEEKGFCLEFHKDGKLVNIQESYDVLYDMSTLTEAEQNILEAFSVFPYIPLAAETCNEWLLADAGVNEEDDILMGLYQKGWLQFELEHEGYALHPVFAQFIHEKCNPGVEKHHELIQICKRSLKKVEVDSVINWLQYISFAESIVEKLNWGKDLWSSGYIYFVAQSLYEMVEMKEKKTCEKLLDMCKDILDEKSLDALLIYNNCVEMYDGQRAKRKAKEFFEKAFTMNESELKKIYSDISCCYNNSKQGWEEKTEESYESMLERHWLDSASRWNDLAFLGIKMGDLETALASYLQAYHICVNRLGINHSATLIVYKNMKITYSKLDPKGNFAQWLEEKMEE